MEFSKFSNNAHGARCRVYWMVRVVLHIGHAPMVVNLFCLTPDKSLVSFGGDPIAGPRKNYAVTIISISS
ncbi:hypothetical protein AgCh_030924 [Apium graveolens]